MICALTVSMRALRIAESTTVSLGLRDEIRRSEQSRYNHRLHGAPLVAQGITCPEVAGVLSDAPRSVENRLRHFETERLDTRKSRGLGGRNRDLAHS
jgi:hypothetical protein